MLIAGSPQFMLFTLVIMRISGFIFLNPVFGRNNIPNIFKTGLVLLISMVIVPTVDFQDVEVIGTLMYGVLLFMELALGFVIGMIMNIYEAIPILTGALTDMQMGLSMANVFDPTTGLQLPMSGTIFQIYYLLLFFAVDGHLAIFKILMSSHEIIPYGTASIGVGATEAMIEIFSEAMSLAVKLALPIVAFEFVTTIAVGLLMKMIPQINLFVMSIQMRVLVGIMMMSVLISPLGAAFNTAITDMVDDIIKLLHIMV